MVRLPVLSQVSIRAFSLYRLRPEVTVDVGPGVFCLAGANGLGKSTFVAALNHGLTGGVAPPTASIQQLSKYRRDAIRHSETYFAGRVGELDRPNAEISLQFQIGPNMFHLTRGFFESYELRYFAVSDQNGTFVHPHDDSTDAEQRQQDYEDWIIRATGLRTFDQFVFLQHFVLSFDEWRRLLFWDARATELVLYLALGLDPTLARRADELRKAASSAGSLARNAQYQATAARQQIRRLTSEVQSGKPIDPGELETHRQNMTLSEELAVDRRMIAQSVADARIELAEASAHQLSLRSAYEEKFASRMADRTMSGVHPIVSMTLADHLCRVCGTQHQNGPAVIVEAIEHARCPLCAADLPSVGAKPSREELSELDSQLREATKTTAALAQTVERLQENAVRVEETLREVQRKIGAFEAAYGSDLTIFNLDADAGMQTQVASLQTAVDVALARKDEQLRLRAEALAELDPIQSQLLVAWRDAEVEFVPRFRRLAESFIGLPLQVELDQGGMLDSAHLALVVDSSHRRKSEQLSESQRFFLDIALRMSLAQHMTRGSAVCLYIDTPEGALDIAYEARAGDMFGNFVEDGDQLVMTANVNTSQLLRRMASRCGNEKMQLVRMTEWTTLSDVQTAEEGLFTEAFELIESALDSAGSN